MKYFTALLLIAVVGSFGVACARDVQQIKLSQKFDAKLARIAASLKARVAEPAEPLSDCDCDGPSCYCCVHVDVKHVVDENICINVTAVPPSDVNLAVDLGSKEVYDKTLNADNLQECIGVFSLADLCIGLDNVNETETSLYACADISVKAFGKTLFTYDFSCFSTHY